MEAAKPLASLGRTAWIGVDGLGCAGKSTLAARLAAAMPSAVVLHVDDFSGPEIAEWDWERFRARVLMPLHGGRPGRYLRRQWDCEDGSEWHDVPAGVVLVIEGVSSTRDEVGVPWDLTIWVDTPYEVRLARALERDGRGMLAKWLDEWIPSEERYLARQAPQQRVDLIVAGTG